MSRRRRTLEAPVTPLWPATFAACVVLGATLTAAGALNTFLQSQRAVDDAEYASMAAELPARIAVVEAELERLGGAHPWAGCWYTGDGLGTNVTLWLAPDTGCVTRWTGCLGLYGANWGSVREEYGVLRVTFGRPNDIGELLYFPIAYELERNADGRFLQSEYRFGSSWTFHELRDEASAPSADRPLESSEPR